MKKIKNSRANVLSAFLANSIAILIGFVSQRVFANTLNAEYLGLNGLFSNIVSMLGVAELGIGSAIIFNLYRPMKVGDKKLVNSLVNFYKKAYHIIALVILGIGITIMPLLNLFIGKLNIDVNIYIIFGLFILDTLASYLLAYRRSILYANKENYIISIVHIGYLIILNALQIPILLLTKNYYLYLSVKIVIRLLENYILHYITIKKFPFLKDTPTKLPDKIKKDIFEKIHGLLFHKIGSFVIMGTDNIIISKFLGVISVGLYSNYAIIINALNTIFSQAIFALIPSVGHLLIAKDQKKNFQTFKKVRNFTFLISLSTSICLLLLTSPFIKIWLGENYILPNVVLLTLVINYFQQMMRSSFVSFKEAAGIYYEDRFIPILESLINIIVSVILVNIMGLPGVFIGTIISSLTLWCYSYPKFVYKKLFGRSYLQYLLETGKYFLSFLVIIFAIYFIF